MYKGEENIDYENLTNYDYRLFEVISWNGKVVKHFKGDLYLILDTHVRHTETNERMVYYKALYGECKTYVRPMSMFMEECNEEQFKKYGQKYRFELTELKSKKKIKNDFNSGDRMYKDIIEDEMNKLKEMIQYDKMYKNVSNNFVRDYDWEDEFSHNQIGEMQKEFMVQAQEYLKERCKGKYGMYCDWCVHICTIEFLKDRNIIRYILC